jgi:hypothetical protein
MTEPIDGCYACEKIAVHRADELYDEILNEGYRRLLRKCRHNHADRNKALEYAKTRWPLPLGSYGLCYPGTISNEASAYMDGWTAAKSEMMQLDPKT